VIIENRLSLTSVDGLELDARLHPPAGTETGNDSGAVILVHGITVDLDEGGMFHRLADRLVSAGFQVLRFSFRGHGSSAGSQRGVTIAGEMLDFDAAVARVRAESSGPLTVVASSFGAVAVLESLRYRRLDRLVLWNPVLDLRRTFIEPELPWGSENFHAEAWRHAMADGALLIDGSFEIGRTMLTELHRYHPGEVFARTTMPALIVHGDRDSYVSYEISLAAARTRGCDFHTVTGSDHGFDSRIHEDEAIAVTVEWIIGPCDISTARRHDPSASLWTSPPGICAGGSP
jgi:uncharacterized protein